MAFEMADFRPPTATTMPRPTMARISAYSAAEAPDSSEKKETSLDIDNPCNSVGRHHGTRLLFGQSRTGTLGGGLVGDAAERVPTSRPERISYACGASLAE